MAPAAQGADPNNRHMKIDSLNHQKFVMDDATGAVEFVMTDVMGSVRECRQDGFVQRSQRKTSTRLEKTDGTTNANRSNKFHVLNQTECRVEVEEVKQVDVDSRFGSCQERLTDPKEGCCENKGDEDGQLGGSQW